MANEIVLALNDVAYAYGDTQTLANITLELRAGTITCLLGASGCGKSTLLKLCAGMLQPQSGTITGSLARPGPHIGYMQQQGGLLPWRTLTQNIALGPELLGRKVDYDAIDSLLVQLDLDGKQNLFPQQLSGGQQQRAVLAQQLILSPQLLLLDEPLSALDIVLRQDMAQLIKHHVAQRNIAALVVTHSPDEAFFLGDQIAIMAGKPAYIQKILHPDSDMTAATAFHVLLSHLQGAQA